MMLSDARVPVSAWMPGRRSDETVIAFVLPDGAGAPVDAPAIERLPEAREGHPSFCPCCLPHAPLAIALHRLYLRRARGDIPFFTAVCAAVSEDDLADALADPLVAPRFRAAVAPASARTAFRCD